MSDNDDRPQCDCPYSGPLWSEKLDGTFGWQVCDEHPEASCERDYCGCCGREIVTGTTDWCMDCLQDHIDTLARRPEEATFYAQHLQPCPFAPQSAAAPSRQYGEAK